MAHKNIEEILNTPIENQRKMWEESYMGAMNPTAIKIIEDQIADVYIEWLILEETLICHSLF
ncbi:hypothetical protein LI951_12985 [Enterococcus sp. BWT-B8]|uniref:hypothetical protein n=1 Tax=Enterococcus sp. BWT-B8 TaxID=2885157 RepID=UPI001E4315CF|nr:hypothetical protein [Enterococcus sp. BWT-B8]MCB5952985.1 hypothetical protein [Enterococcus sp. BWT-B8]